MEPRLKYITKIKKVLFIVAFCIIAGAYFSLIEYGYNLDSTPDEIDGYNFIFSIVAQCLAGLIGGTVFGYIEVFYFRDYFRRKSFGMSILYESGVFFLLFLVISFLVSLAYTFIYVNKNLIRPESIEYIKNYFTSVGFLMNFLNWMFVLVIILFALQISDKFGEGVFKKFLLGLYHKPKEEVRIFMFLDIKGSTGIAEKLGHTKYFEFLKDFYNDATGPIINNKGEIYQYVGDEITVSWQLTKGLDGSRCIDCFFDIKEQLYKKRFYYEGNYNIIPEFKAGIHFGLVTVGEVGIVKKEIIYSGDLLNTTARIMEECKNYNSDLIISQDLADSLEIRNKFNFAKIGEIELRGKQNKVSLLGVTV